MGIRNHYLWITRRVPYRCATTTASISHFYFVQLFRPSAKYFCRPKFFFCPTPHKVSFEKKIHLEMATWLVSKLDQLTAFDPVQKSPSLEGSSKQ